MDRTTVRLLKSWGSKRVILAVAILAAPVSTKLPVDQKWVKSWSICGAGWSLVWVNLYVGWPLLPRDGLNPENQFCFIVHCAMKYPSSCSYIYHHPHNENAPWSVHDKSNIVPYLVAICSPDHLWWWSQQSDPKHILNAPGWGGVAGNASFPARLAALLWTRWWCLVIYLRPDKLDTTWMPHTAKSAVQNI